MTIVRSVHVRDCKTMETLSQCRALVQVDSRELPIMPTEYVYMHAAADDYWHEWRREIYKVEGERDKKLLYMHPHVQKLLYMYICAYICHRFYRRCYLTSYLAVISITVAAIHGLYFLAALGVAVLVTSINYWRHPTRGLRRTLGMIYGYLFVTVFPYI